VCGEAALRVCSRGSCGRVCSGVAGLQEALFGRCAKAAAAFFCWNNAKVVGVMAALMYPSSGPAPCQASVCMQRVAGSSPGLVTKGVHRQLSGAQSWADPQEVLNALVSRLVGNLLPRCRDTLHHINRFQVRRSWRLTGCCS
jgi:hypothetical protein